MWTFDDKETARIFALKFSEDNNIVKSDKWANSIPEKIDSAGRIAGFHHSQETLKKIVAANTGKKRTEETKRKFSVWQKGKPKSEEFKKRVSETLTGKPKTEKHKKNLRTPRPNARMPKSEEFKAQVSRTMKCVPKSEQTKQNMAWAQRRRAFEDGVSKWLS